MSKVPSSIHPLINMNYFHPTRSEPFFVILFRAVLALRKVCKMIRKKINLRYLKNTSNGKKMSILKYEVINTTKLIDDAKKGRDVIKFMPSTSQINVIEKVINNIKNFKNTNEGKKVAHQREQASSLAAQRLQLKLKLKRNTYRAVEKHLDTYQLKERMGMLIMMITMMVMGLLLMILTIISFLSITFILSLTYLSYYYHRHIYHYLHHLHYYLLYKVKVHQIQLNG